MKARAESKIIFDCQKIREKAGIAENSSVEKYGGHLGKKYSNTRGGLTFIQEYAILSINMYIIYLQSVYQRIEKGD